jgi:hypothetical protein
MPNLFATSEKHKQPEIEYIAWKTYYIHSEKA